MNKLEVHRIVLGPLPTLLILLPLVPSGPKSEDISNNLSAFNPTEPLCPPEVEGQGIPFKPLLLCQLLSLVSNFDAASPSNVTEAAPLADVTSSATTDEI
jgi:hypothetical protein